MAEHSNELHRCSDAEDDVIDPPGSPESATNVELDDFLALVTRYEAGVAAVVGRFLDDQRDVEEATQDTFVQAWRHRDRFRHESAVFTWLYRIAVNNALMRLRRARPGNEPLDSLTGADQRFAAHDPLDHHPATLDAVDRVRAALAALPEHHRMAVLLRDVEGHSNTEAAAMLQIPVTTFKAHLHRGRAALRGALHP